MQRNALSLVLSALCLFLAGCGGARRAVPESRPVVKRPLALLVSQEISGRILQQRLSEPFGLAVDNSGTLYVADAGNNRIVHFNSDLDPDRDFGGYGSRPGLFDGPGFMVVDNSLNLLVSDGGNRRVARCDGKLNYVNEIQLVDDEDPLKFGLISGVAVTDYGEVWVADRENNRVAVFDNLGRFDRFIGEFGYAGGELSSPEKIYHDAGGPFVVCDAGNGRLVFYDDYGNYSHQLAADAFDYPIALAADRQRHYWVLDGRSGVLFCFSLSGEPLFRAGPLLPGTSLSLRKPSDVAVLRDGRLVIADTGNHRLLVCTVVYEEP
ncbi:MAG TPA: NHL repeat-containing protein [Acidobacteriota bacterium]|nr:NHL repeat-containing protein [Acidobacteriota bacterium]